MRYSLRVCICCSKFPGDVKAISPPGHTRLTRCYRMCPIQGREYSDRKKTGHKKWGVQSRWRRQLPRMVMHGDTRRTGEYRSESKLMDLLRQLNTLTEITTRGGKFEFELVIRAQKN